MFSILKGITMGQDELDQHYINKRKQNYEEMVKSPNILDYTIGK